VSTAFTHHCRQLSTLVADAGADTLPGSAS
jgi:hypothetical protein